MSTEGICQYIVTEIYAKGLLVDILSFSIMKMDWSFKNSLIKDAVFVRDIFLVADNPLRLWHQIFRLFDPVRRELHCSNELYDLMERCWKEIPVERPTFPKIKERLKKVIGDYGDNIVDVLFKRMEQGERVDPEAYENVSIYFSNIVGFTTIAAAGSPREVVSPSTDCTRF
ncbi:hypothetical protein BV898_03068 [Hypsibius exemplaris]|uniref:Guanylate cyclase domain-containing protein n=1 Tax=Hypsibius exemplaris TaxID=2072580 RepID=A0A1W0X676_HYPEX|nr:hypothetical protein BV898_03068 [Hypsibius exemplaris]